MYNVLSLDEYFLYMLNKRIRFIFIAMILSLTGIFLFQGYWIYNSYKISNTQFESEVNALLQKIQSKYTLNDLAETGLTSDRLSIESLLSLAAAMRPGSQSIKRNNKDSLVIESSLSNKPGRIASIVYTDTLRKSLDTNRITSRSFLSNEKFKITIKKTGNISRAELEQTALYLKKDLDTAFKNAGIKNKINFLLTNIDTSGSTYATSNHLYKADKEKLFQINIGIAKPVALYLELENQLVYVLKKMQWVLVATFLIIGITIVAFVYMLRTIFEQKKLSEVKNDFINNMTHEFKTPIATVSLAVEAMKNFDVMEKPQQAKEYLEICQHELKRISNMVEKVLKIAAQEKSEINLNIQKVNIGKLIEGVISNMKPALEQANAKYTINTNSVKIEAMVDPDHFSNVIYNLMDNALKYANNQPEITIKCALSNHNTFQVSVQDKGIGIPKTYQDRVFDQFFRVPKGNLHNIKGFGLGLSYVATIVQKHNGNILLQSVENKGTTILITLPVHAITSNF